MQLKKQLNNFLHSHIKLKVSLAACQLNVKRRSENDAYAAEDVHLLTSTNKKQLQLSCHISFYA